MVNKVILVGNLGKDPEVKHFENNNANARFTLATNETYTDKSGQRQTVTEWHNLVVWGKQAEIAEKFLHKGSKVYVEGKITSRKYQDNEGKERYITEIVVDTFRMLDPKEGGQQGGSYGEVKESSGTTYSPDTSGDDLPF